jgi:N-hydroxyarylamine O-acetyltransferase
MDANRELAPLGRAERDAYLWRIGVARGPGASADALTELHRAHLGTVPFENLDIHLGVPIELELERIVAKLVGLRRGGFCYELNGAFAALLSSLGFGVALLEARVFGEQGLGPRFDHLCLAVEVDGGPVLADVGFGECFRAPFRLAAGVEHADESGTYRLAHVSECELDVYRDGEPQYRLDTTPRALADFAAACRYHQTSSESHFTRNTVVSLPTEKGRVTLRGLRLIETVGDEREERDLGTDELAPVLAIRFGIELDDAALARLARAAR